MKYLTKYQSTIFFILLAILIYLASRLVNLTTLPIFTDEAIYLRWAQIAKNDANWRFISLTDGKQPLYIWLTMIAMKVIQDPLSAGRLVSVASGLFGLFSIYLLARELFKKEVIAWFSVVLFLLSPFSLFYQRMALMDGLLSSLILFTVYLEVLLVKKNRLDIALILGMAMGASMLTKTSGFFTLYLFPLAILLFDFRQKNRNKQFLKFIVLALISSVLSQMFYAVLRLSPLFHMVAQKDTTFVYPIGEWITHPFEFFIGNLRGLLDWLLLYSTWPVVLLTVLSLLFSVRKFFRQRWFLFLWFAAPFVLLALFGKVLYPRFIAFMVMPFLILSASLFSELSEVIKNKKYLFSVALLIVLPLAIFVYQILFNITRAPLTTIDRGQYVNDWPAGWGVKEAVAILQKEADKGKIAIYTDGTFGLLPYAVELYMVYDPNVKIVGIWPVPDQLPAGMAGSAAKQNTYFIANQIPKIPDSWPVWEIGRWQKGINDQSFLRLYQIKTR